MSFLEKADFPCRPLNLNINGLSPIGLFLGKGSQAIEVAVFSSSVKPTDRKVQEAFKKRRSSRATPVLIVVKHSEGVTLCGTNGNNPPIHNLNDLNQAERLCATALEKPNRNSSIRFLVDAIPSLATELSGISNEGLLSNHELKSSTKFRPDWDNAVKKAESILGKSKRALISALGFTIQKFDNFTELLVVGEEQIAIAVLLEEEESPQIATTRFNDSSPISYALTKADKARIPWVMMVQGDGIRLYNTKNIGVARRGRTETYIECQTSLLPTKNLGYLWLLFSSEALKQNGSITSILEKSKRFAADIAEQLRERVYGIVIPQLAIGISKARNLINPTKTDISLTYEMAVTVLFRLLFIAYGEDRDLLPFKSNEAYRKRSLKKKSKELAQLATQNIPIAIGEHHWIELSQLWDSISIGNKEWGLPAYGGTMFSSDASVSQTGAELANISLPNESFEEVLRTLLLLESTEIQYTPIDFSSLSVREFGTIYEGLLESELSIAQENLTIDKKRQYVPSVESDEVIIRKGDIYLHDKSGARKSSGSYFTREFAVEYILDSTLEPALDEHLEHLSKLSEADRTDQFFDFRVADIAMGSGHFLVSAIDRIERRFAIWLEQNPTPGIPRELQYLRDAAKNALGDLAETFRIEDGQLLRRMIARRCIYGVDLNFTSVQLSQLSVWIHTFVPGLPLSLLEHNLTHGNSLVGVSSLEEIRKKFNESQGKLFEVNANNFLAEAEELFKELARLSDSSIKDIDKGRTLMEEARKKLNEIKALCDIITTIPLAIKPDGALAGYMFENWSLQKNDLQNSSALKEAETILENVHPIHFPVCFPEVFLSQSQGFNVILGNPPWEEAVINEDKFWARYKPGLAGMKAGEQEALKHELRQKRSDLVNELKQELKQAKLTRDLLHAGDFPGMSIGDPDLYKAFFWRFWSLLSKDHGRIGVIMPRSALSAKGSADFRRKLLTSVSSIDITTLQNNKRWVFDMEPRYTVALISICISKSVNTLQNGVSLKGPFDSLVSFMAGKDSDPQKFKFSEVLKWNESISLPLMPTTYSSEVFAQLRKSPWLSINEQNKWRARPDREMDATNQKSLMHFSSECPDGFWPVYKGASFDLWNPDTGEYNAFADPKKVLKWLQKKRLRSNIIKRDSVHKEFSKEFVRDESTLAALYPRIAFRDVTNRTNKRTVIACLIPPRTFITNKGPVLMFPRGDQKDEAFLLGILSSIPLDWYARRFVEVNLNFFILNPFPIPRPSRDNLLWQRVVQIAGRLASPDERFSEWAQKVGVDYGPLNKDLKQDKIHELDAIVSHLYGLTERQLICIFKTFHKDWDYESRLSQVLKHYYAYSKKISNE